MYFVVNSVVHNDKYIWFDVVYKTDFLVSTKANAVIPFPSNPKTNKGTSTKRFELA